MKYYPLSSIVVNTQCRESGGLGFKAVASRRAASRRAAPPRAASCRDKASLRVAPPRRTELALPSSRRASLACVSSPPAFENRTGARLSPQPASVQAPLRPRTRLRARSHTHARAHTHTHSHARTHAQTYAPHPSRRRAGHRDA